MKRSHIVIFLFSVLASLMLLCAVFPENGLKGLRFPQLSEILSSAEKPSGPSPEELLDERKKAILEAERDQYWSFFREDPARFYLPDDDIGFFDSLFDALEQAERQPIRIVHYGDSQIEGDRITGTIRERLQACFGGNGPGMLPAFRHSTSRMDCINTAVLERYFIYGGATHKAGIRQYGPFADFVRLDTFATLSYSQARIKGREQSTFERVTLVAGRLQGNLSVSCKGQRQLVKPGESLSFVRFEIPDSSAQTSLTVSGYADLYGVLLDSKTGVRMDNVPMRGCSGTIFTAMDATQLQRFYEEENVRLIIMQFGGNSVPVLNGERSISTYMTSIKKQIRYLQDLAPKAKIIFIGPSDMSTTIAGKRQSYPRLGTIVDSLRTSANDCGAAYWDIYGVMGGENSMLQWVSARPQLAGPDHIHFTRAGARRVGEIFSDTFFLYYDYYRWRKENE